MPTTRIGIAITIYRDYIDLLALLYVRLSAVLALSEHVNLNHTFLSAATRHSGISINKCRTASTRPTLSLSNLTILRKINANAHAAFIAISLTFDINCHII